MELKIGTYVEFVGDGDDLPWNPEIGAIGVVEEIEESQFGFSGDLLYRVRWFSDCDVKNAWHYKFELFITEQPQTESLDDSNNKALDDLLNEFTNGGGLNV